VLWAKRDRRRVVDRGSNQPFLIRTYMQVLLMPNANARTKASLWIAIHAKRAAARQREREKGSVRAG
jgi:hypothetical protein